MSASMFGGLTALLLGALALLVPTNEPEILASEQVTQVALTPRGEKAGEISVTVQLVRVDGQVQSRVAIDSTLKGPAVANGTLTVTGEGQQELARSNPRQVSTVLPGKTAHLVTPMVKGDARCTQAQVNVWSGPMAPSADPAARQGPELQPTFISVNVCRS